MVIEKFGVEFLLKIVEVVYLDDIDVKIFQLFKFEDMVELNQNLFIVLEFGIFMKIEVEFIVEVVKNLDLKVCEF